MEVSRMKMDDRILLNMAINNTERVFNQDAGILKFKTMVEQRFKVYREIHEEEQRRMGE